MKSQTTKSGAQFLSGLLPSVILIVVLSLMLAGCDRSARQDIDNTPVLRIHDVTALNVEDLDAKLNDLLNREDLPLKGQTELMNDRRLAVNGSEHLQTQIARILDELSDIDAPGATVSDREVRLQFWLLSLSEAEAHAPLPASLENIGETISSEFPGLNLIVEDYGDFFHWPGSSITFRSGTGTQFHLRPFQTSEEYAQLRASILMPRHLGGNRYEINRKFTPGQALVLGRSRVGGEAESRYQVLVARMDWVN